MDDYILVGKTRKTHGIKGELKIEIDDKFVEDVLPLEVVFLKIQGKLLPYFVEWFDFTNKLIVKFEDINSPEEATSITSKDFFIRKSDIKQIEQVDYISGNLIYGKLKGYTIKDKEQGQIGEIVGVLEFPQQEMAQVVYNEKEILIPLNKDLISEIDDTNNVLLMNLPEGLIEL